MAPDEPGFLCEDVFLKSFGAAAVAVLAFGHEQLGQERPVGRLFAVGGVGNLAELAADDAKLLARLVTLGCDPTAEVRNGLLPIDVALLHRASVVRSLLERVPVEDTWRVAAHAVDVALARDLLDSAASASTAV